MFESGGFAQRREGTGSGRKPRADPDEATYVADQGHAAADCQAAAFQLDPGSADYRVIVARVLGLVVSRITEGRDVSGGRLGRVGYKKQNERLHCNDPR